MGVVCFVNSKFMFISFSFHYVHFYSVFQALPRRSMSLSTELEDQSDDASTLEAGQQLPENNNTIDSQGGCFPSPPLAKPRVYSTEL